jgi:hypothetical protein
MRLARMKEAFTALCISTVFISCCSTQESQESVSPPPPAPTGLKATIVSKTRVDLSWDPPTGGDNRNFISTFRIYRDGKLLSPSYAGYMDTNGLGPGSQYCYWITSVNNYGKESAKSESACVTTPLNWPRTYAESAYTAAGYSVVQASDGGYVVAGHIDYDAYLIKTGPDGNVQWTKSYGQGACNAIRRTSEGGYIAACGGSLLRTDETGSILWQQYNGSGTVRDVQQTSDGGYVIVGEIPTRPWSDMSGTIYLPDIYLLKTDSGGYRVWSKTYLGEGFESNYGYSVQQTADGGYIIAGEKDSSSTATPTNAYLIKTDSSGNVLWEKTWSGAGRSVHQTADGGYIITGERYSSACLIKTDSQGNSIWQELYGGNDVQLTPDGGYIVTGGVDNGSGTADIYVAKTDSNGAILWARTLGGIVNDYGRSIQLTSDGGYIITGDTQKDLRDYDSAVYLVKIDANGNVQ